MGYVIEEESGWSTGFVHEHNGYYAGDFFPESEATSRREPTTARAGR